MGNMKEEIICVNYGIQNLSLEQQRAIRNFVNCIDKNVFPILVQFLGGFFGACLYHLVYMRSHDSILKWAIWAWCFPGDLLIQNLGKQTWTTGVRIDTRTENSSITHEISMISLNKNYGTWHFGCGHSKRVPFSCLVR